MIINIERFQADLPYPPVGTAYPDKDLADKLLQGYAGKTSELTTVLQYAYHSLQCKLKYMELSAILRGIFYVETIHMELLGECLIKLGGDTHYNATALEPSTCWRASWVDYEASPLSILQTDIEGEKNAANFYLNTAKACNQPDIKRLLLRLAEDEKLHYRIFTDLYHRYKFMEY